MRAIVCAVLENLEWRVVGEKTVTHLVNIIDKLDEARFFLDHIKAQPEAFDVGYYVNAFAGTCYSFWECLEKLCVPVQGFGAPCSTCGMRGAGQQPAITSCSEACTAGRHLPASPAALYARVTT